MGCNNPNCGCDCLPETSQQNAKVASVQMEKKKKKGSFLKFIFWVLKYTPAIAFAVLIYLLIIEKLLDFIAVAASPIFMIATISIFAWGLHIALQKIYRLSQEKQSKTFEYGLYFFILVSIFLTGYFAVGSFVAHNLQAGLVVKLTSAMATLVLGGYFYIHNIAEFLGVSHKQKAHSSVDCGCG